MSWLKIPTSFRTPVVNPGSGSSPYVFYKGIGSDAGTFRFYGTGIVWFCDLPHYVISADFCFHIVLNGKKFVPVFEDVNNNIYFRYYNGLGYEYIWYTGSIFKWVYGNGPGVYPTESYNGDTGTWEGSTFYSTDFNTFVFLDDMTKIFTPRGSIHDTGSPITATLKWDRWQSGRSDGAGEYVSKGGATGIRYFGTPYWTRDGGIYYYRSVSKKDGYYTYGRVHYESEKWIYGTLNNPYGWWEGSEPSKTSPVTFTPKYPEGVTGPYSPFTLTFAGYDNYDHNGEKETVYLGEAAIYR